MKRTVITVLVFFFAFQLIAQQVRPFEFEIRAGAAMPINRIHGSNRSDGPVFGIELRHNFKNSPFDIGFTMVLTNIYYEFKSKPANLEQCNLTAMTGLTSDYNFHQGGTVNPFVGIGFGYGLQDAMLDEVYDNSSDNGNIIVTPRIGVELWRHLRLTLAANLSIKYYNSLSLTVGYAIGGGKKKSDFNHNTAAGPFHKS